MSFAPYAVSPPPIKCLLSCVIAQPRGPRAAEGNITNEHSLRLAKCGG